MNLMQTHFLSNRLNGIAGSPMLALIAKTAELRSQGRDIIGLAAGEPDFDTPVHIQDAAVAAIRRGDTRYTAPEGTLALRNAIARKFRRENQLAYSTDQIIVSVGAKQVIYNAFAATLNPEDQVIIPTPSYPAYAEMVKMCAGMPVGIACDASQGFKLRPEQLHAAITPRTKWLVLCSPSNPTGAVYTEAELCALGEVLRDHPHVWVLTDDIYEHLLFSGNPFATIAAAAPHLYERTLVVNGVSKAYCMTGWRIGYGAGSRELVKAMTTVQSQSTSSPCSISQSAAVAALDGPHDFLKAHQAAYRERRDLVVSQLNAAEHVSCNTPDGAFYVLASCEAAIGRATPNGEVISSDTAFVAYLLESEGVVVVPGTAFEMPGYFRISYAADTQTLSSACERIAKATSRLN
ncbi:pyridoxal phosphate-dependent aminotransferase [Variovorax paradoxus]|uniref:pyridoxal phosphate-dependent aminotransferase n=1 Tax=Variovorax paradoxus TaxID=34073 RepID=UPI003D66210E